MRQKRYKRYSRKKYKRSSKVLILILCFMITEAIYLGWDAGYLTTGPLSSISHSIAAKAQDIMEDSGAADFIAKYLSFLPDSKENITLSDIPAYSGSPYIELNGNIPDFTEDELQKGPYEYYSEQDRLGRCGYAEAMIDRSLMPTEERGPIGMVKPSGWHTVKYDCVDGKYLYNRCHLLAYMLTGENANEKNLITGTRYMNVEGMLPFENEIADYVHKTGDRVLYRVTPIYEGNNLLASGVEMQAESVGSKELRFHVFIYNVQPFVSIDYANGNSWLENGE